MRREREGVRREREGVRWEREGVRREREGVRREREGVRRVMKVVTRLGTMHRKTASSLTHSTSHTNTTYSSYTYINMYSADYKILSPLNAHVACTKCIHPLTHV